MFVQVLDDALTFSLTFFTRMSSADDKAKFSNRLKKIEIQNLITVFGISMKML